MEQEVITLFEYIESINLKYIKRNYLGKLKIINKDTVENYNKLRNFLQDNNYNFNIINENKIMIFLIDK